MNRLTTQFISQDSAVQRSGRAGRLSAGTCYRLWTEQQQKRLLKHAVTEILHSDLSSLILEISNWGATTEELHWLDTPEKNSTEAAWQLLKKLNAIDYDNKITRHGKNILKLGCHPRLGHMMLASIEIDQAYHACLIAGLLSERDLYLSSGEKTFDIHDRIKILSAPVATNNTRTSSHIDKQQCKRIKDTANEFYKRLKPQIRPKQEKVIDDELSGVLLAYAYPDRIAKQRNNKAARYLLSNGKGAAIPIFLQDKQYETIVVANLDSKQGEANIYLAAEISTFQIETFLHDQIIEKESIRWNVTEQRVETKLTRSIGKIILKETQITPEDKTAVIDCLIQVIKEAGLQCFNWTEQALNLRQRVQFINTNKQNHVAIEKQLKENPLPDYSDNALLKTLEEWLQPYLKNENSFKHCRKIDLYNLLLNGLSWQQQQFIEQLAPEKILVPSGSSIRIDYSDANTPVLAVRLQEVFGLYETPTVLNGNVRLMMHLLSPARRPMQVTQDLNSFWQSTYHEVKKELRGKYKRHYWPDDPFTAQATSRTKKQMNKENELLKNSGQK